MIEIRKKFPLGMERLIGKGHEKHFWDDENILHLAFGCRFWVDAIVKTRETEHLTAVHFIVYILQIKFLKWKKRT